MPSSPPRKAMIFELRLADWFTLANAACGMAAVFSALAYLESHEARFIYRSCGLIVAALLLVWKATYNGVFWGAGGP